MGGERRSNSESGAKDTARAFSKASSRPPGVDPPFGYFELPSHPCHILLVAVFFSVLSTLYLIYPLHCRPPPPQWGGERAIAERGGGKIKRKRDLTKTLCHKSSKLCRRSIHRSRPLPPPHSPPRRHNLPPRRPLSTQTRAALLPSPGSAVGAERKKTPDGVGCFRFTIIGYLCGF